MIKDFVGAIYYNVDLTPLADNLACRVSVASCLAAPEGATLLRSLGWRCALPDPNMYVEEAYGSSEPVGFVGGIRRPLLAAQSEAIERSLGDGLTLALADILDRRDQVKVILVLGPGFPKAVGRFLSLRPPEQTNIIWLYPLSGSGEGASRLLPAELAGQCRRSLNLDGENLVSTVIYPAHKPRWRADFIDMEGSKARAETVSSVLGELASDHSVKDDMLPREMIFSEAGLVPDGKRNFIGPESMAPTWFQPPATLVGQPLMGRNRLIYPWKVQSPVD